MSFLLFYLFLLLYFNILLIKSNWFVFFSLTLLTVTERVIAHHFIEFIDAGNLKQMWLYYIILQRFVAVINP